MRAAEGLRDLQESFGDFVQNYPEIGHKLGLQDTKGPRNPDARYLLEAFLHITDDLSQKIDAVHRRHSQALLRESGCCWLNPVPHSTVLQLEPQSHADAT